MKKKTLLGSIFAQTAFSLLKTYVSTLRYSIISLDLRLLQNSCIVSYVRGQRTLLGVAMKSQDIFILLKLISMAKSPTNHVADSAAGKNETSARRLAQLTGVGKTEVNASINRSVDVGLAKRALKDQSISVNTKSLLEFIVYGIKFVFPVRPAELVRGMPTAHAAPVMKGQLMGAADSVLVWPDASSSTMGQSLRPLYKTVPEAAAADPIMYGYLALVDAIRVGGARESAFAIKLLTKELRS